MTSGLLLKSANCASMESPPTSAAIRKSVNFANSFANLNVCNANSRVGANTTHRAPAFRLCVRSLLSVGIKNAAVFPLPVLAMATTSRPSSAGGIDFR